MKYTDLSDKERYEIIKLGVQNGITNLDDIEKAYNEYANGGSLKQDDYYNNVVLQKDDEQKQQIKEQLEERRTYADGGKINDIQSLFKSNPIEAKKMWDNLSDDDKKAYGVEGGFWNVVNDISHKFGDGDRVNNAINRLKQISIENKIKKIRPNEEFINKQDNTYVNNKFNKDLSDYEIKNNSYEFPNNELGRYYVQHRFELKNPDDIYLLDKNSLEKYAAESNRAYNATKNGGIYSVEKPIFYNPENINDLIIDENLKSGYYDKVEGVNQALDYYNSEGFKQRASNMSEYKNNNNFLPKVTQIKIGDSDHSSSIDDVSSITFEMPYNTREKIDGEYFNFDNYFTGAHEFAHNNNIYNKYDENKEYDDSPYYKHYDYSGISDETKNILKPKNAANIHDEELNENYSDLVGLRVLMNMYGIFDSNKANNIFTEEDYDKMINNGLFEDNRFLKKHSKQQVIDAVNKIAYNNINTNNLNFA